MSLTSEEIVTVTVAEDLTLTETVRTLYKDSGEVVGDKFESETYPNPSDVTGANALTQTVSAAVWTP